MNAALKILNENATTYRERNEISALLEGEVAAVNNSMIANLYKSAIEKAHVDFDDIPKSKGDITRYSGYQPMLETLDVVQEAAIKQGVKVPEIETIKEALVNIVTYRDLFDKGFRLDKEFIILNYNSLVYACVEATSIIVSSYVDFAKHVDRIEFNIVKDTRRGGSTAIHNLEKFNMAVKKGDFQKALKGIISTGKESLVGVDDTIIVSTLLVGAVLAIVPLMRELVFGFYYSRMQLSDFLAHQAMLLEINRKNVEASRLSAGEKNAIIKKQAQKIDKLRKMSETIKVDNTMADNKATIEMKRENKNWTIGNVRSQSASADAGGFQLL